VPFEIDGQTMYRTKEACSLAGTNVNTYFRWVREGRFPDTEYRDRNGWRLFTTGHIQRLQAKVKKISRVNWSP